MMRLSCGKYYFLYVSHSITCFHVIKSQVDILIIFSFYDVLQSYYVLMSTQCLGYEADKYNVSIDLRVSNSCGKSC